LDKSATVKAFAVAFFSILFFAEVPAGAHASQRVDIPDFSFEQIPA
jgi:hypothetical protein